MIETLVEIAETVGTSDSEPRADFGADEESAMHCWIAKVGPQSAMHCWIAKAGPWWRPAAWQRQRSLGPTDALSQLRRPPSWPRIPLVAEPPAAAAAAASVAVVQAEPAEAVE